MRVLVMEEEDYKPICRLQEIMWIGDGDIKSMASDVVMI